jgi:hypothetical protein
MGESRAETAEMTLAEVGGVQRVRDAHWRACIAGRTIPATDEMLSRIVGQEWPTVRDAVMATFTVTVTDTGPVLVHERDAARAAIAARNYNSRKAASDKANAAKRDRDGARQGDRDGARQGDRDGDRIKNRESIYLRGESEKKLSTAPKTPTREWYETELRRLKAMFGELASLMISHCQSRDESGNLEHGNVGFVKAFKGARFDPGNDARAPTITMRTADDVSRVLQQHSEWLDTLCDGRLIVRGPGKRTPRASTASIAA